MDLFFTLLLLTPMAFATKNAQNFDSCDSLQYAEYGKIGKIECFFNEEFYGVFWFNSTDHINEYPLVTMKNSVKSGHGYEFGEFDISPNGSLIINQVLPKHEHNYTVFKLDSVGSQIVPLYIYLNVTGWLYQQGCQPDQFLELEKPGILHCFFSKPFFGVFWFDTSDHVNSFPVAMVRESVKSGDGYLSGEYDIDEQGSLIINKVSPLHERTFTVFKLQTVTEKTEPHFINVAVYALPTPDYPIINDCNIDEKCAIEVQREGILQCSVKRIRPIPQLQWNFGDNVPFHGEIYFTSHNQTHQQNGVVYDVFLTSKFLVNGSSTSRIKIKCIAFIVSVNNFLNFSSEAYLLLPQGNVTFKETTQTTYEERHEVSKAPVVAALLVSFSIFVVIVVTTSIIYYKHRLKKKDGDEADGHNMPLVKDCKTNLIEHLGKNYEDAFNKTQYDRFKTFCLDTRNCFVKALDMIELTNTHSWPTVGRKVFGSYTRFLNDTSLKGKTYILTGESGCGKSTLVLQLAIDWHTKRECSFETPELVVLLPFHNIHVTRAESVTDAIKKCCLPEISNLDEEKIQTVLSSASSVLIVFDGIDTYPGGCESAVKVIQSFLKKMQKNVTTIITTNSSSDLQKIVPDATVLTVKGCDNKVRTDIFASVSNCIEEEVLQRMKDTLDANSALQAVCTIPFLLTLFINVFQEESTFQTVGGFLEEVINKFQRELEKTEKDEICESYNTLGKEAFESIKSYKQLKIWEKEELIQLIGVGCYKTLVKTAILVEEGSFRVTGNSSFYVKFHHYIFCEWYAAKYLSNKFENPPEGMLEDVEPLKRPYFYYFLVGLSRIGADKLTQFFRRTTGLEKFTIICMTENVAYEKKIKDLIHNFVSREVHLSGEDDVVEQQHTIHILNLASKLESPIQDVTLRLENNFDSVDIPSKEIRMKRDVKLPMMTSIRKLCIKETDKEFTTEETKNILTFIAGCKGVTTWRFENCLFPRETNVNITPDEPTEVFWIPKSKPHYVFDFNSSGWKRHEGTKEPITDSDFDRIEKMFRQSDRIDRD